MGPLSGLWDLLRHLLETALSTLCDIAPIAAILFGFQYLVIRQPLPYLKTIITGFVYVVLGLTLFLVGLERALFPLGTLMAEQLSDPAFEGGPGSSDWRNYVWIYVFAAAIGFATTIAEPSLIAVALKANQVSGGGISTWGLRVAVAIGVAVGVSLGTFRIVTGTPLHYYIIAGYVVVILQALRADRSIISLAYDSGGVTTSTVTVPLVAALGIGLASSVPGRSSLIDGFGLIAFASLFPIVSVLGYSWLVAWTRRRGRGE